MLGEAAQPAVQASTAPGGTSCTYAVGTNSLGVQVTFLQVPWPAFETVEQDYLKGGATKVDGVGQAAFAVASRRTTYEALFFYGGGYNMGITAEAPLPKLVDLAKAVLTRLQRLTGPEVLARALGPGPRPPAPRWAGAGGDRPPGAGFGRRGRCWGAGGGAHDGIVGFTSALPATPTSSRMPTTSGSPASSRPSSRISVSGGRAASSAPGQAGPHPCLPGRRRLARARRGAPASPLTPASPASPASGAAPVPCACSSR